ATHLFWAETPVTKATSIGNTSQRTVDALIVENLLCRSSPVILDTRNNQLTQHPATLRLMGNPISIRSSPELKVAKERPSVAVAVIQFDTVAPARSTLDDA